MPASSRNDVIRRVLRGLALQRTPGFNFPGHFLQLAFERVSEGGARVALDVGPHCADARGQAHIGPLAVLADIALASSLRAAVGKGSRLATVSMSIQLTGAPRTGRLVATSGFDGFVASGAERQGLTRAEIRSGRTLVATATGAFMVIGHPNATAPHPLPKRGEHADLTLAAEDLNDGEREVVKRAQAALGQDAVPFIEHFWGCLPKRTAKGATCRAPNGPHIGNRVGHVQGGCSFGFAAATACAALPDNWSLVGISSWYVGPGIGKRLVARSEIVHRGSLTAVVHTRIEDEEKRGVLETVTSHARGASAIPAPDKVIRGQAPSGTRSQE